jgi:hypothetical protein
MADEGAGPSLREIGEKSIDQLAKQHDLLRDQCAKAAAELARLEGEVKAKAKQYVNLSIEVEAELKRHDQILARLGSLAKTKAEIKGLVDGCLSDLKGGRA